MANPGLCETARLAFFSARSRLLVCLDWETETETPKWLCKKKKKMTLRDARNPSTGETVRPIKFD